MNHCKIVEDLLPLYLDNLTSPETAEYIQEHLNGCSACSEIYQRMKSDALREKEPCEPDFKKALRRGRRRIALGAIASFLLAVGIAAYLIWEVGFLAPRRVIESPDGSRSFTVCYFDGQGIFTRCGGYIITPDGRGRNYRGDESFIDAHVYWAPNSEYYFVWIDCTDRDESFYWGYNARNDDDSYHYRDRFYPQNEDFFGMLAQQCREHPHLKQNEQIEFTFLEWSAASDAMRFGYETDDGQSGTFWYSIVTNSISRIQK
ncbi:MAG: zf-HC2 domain-containing protein [Oscillospiraceae bacterium]|nr:zf-HC2 domain-containing protein [Oscillospiraceae bacterium]